MLPEKFYESCITYNLIQFHKIHRNEILYPISFSQANEKIYGLDFGYINRDSIFFLQYKRPYRQTKQKTWWKIDIKQLCTICSLSKSWKAYYALPTFVNNLLWYEGLEHCYFIDALDLYDSLSLTEKTHLIDSDCALLQLWFDIAEERPAMLGSTASTFTTSHRPVPFGADFKIDGLWLYVSELALPPSESQKPLFFPGKKW